MTLLGPDLEAHHAHVPHGDGYTKPYSQGTLLTHVIALQGRRLLLVGFAWDKGSLPCRSCCCGCGFCCKPWPLKGAMLSEGSAAMLLKGLVGEGESP